MENKDNEFTDFWGVRNPLEEPNMMGQPQEGDENGGKKRSVRRENIRVPVEKKGSSSGSHDLNGEGPERLIEWNKTRREGEE